MPELPMGWVLVVDDTEAIRYATARMLRGGGYAVVEAATGLETLEQARRMPELIVLDIHLPDISGYEVSRRLKADPATAAIPILHLTATYLEAEDRAASLEDGADAFLREPVEPRELLASVGALLRMKDAEKRARRAAEEVRELNLDLEERVARRTAELLASKSELQKTEETYRRLFENMRNGVAYCRMLFERDLPVDWIYVNVNRAFEQQTGLVGVAGKRVSEVIPGIRQTSPDLFDVYGRVSRTGRSEQVETYVPGLKDWYSISVYSPELEHFVAVFDVITKRKEAERALQESHDSLEEHVRERTASLEEANRELDAFSYSVSHELRTPLRAIDSFSAAIAEEYEGVLDDEGRRLFGRVRWNAQRMGRLIDDLLAFSRAGRSDLLHGTVDMTGSARTAFANVVPDTSAQARIDFSLGDLPRARGDAALLQRVWENLLSNAVKFSGERERPEIQVEGSVEDGVAVYRVQDNGVGFDMKYVDKLFGVFHRLHGQGAYEGSGVGLALVRRIVVRHGGKVWAEGVVNGGATFSFSLPAASPER